MADKSLFTRLKRLFSTSVIVRNVGGKNLRVADTDNLQAYVSNTLRDRYARMYAGGMGYAGPGTQYGTSMAFQTQRVMLFRDYDAMSQDPIIHSALDIYADEATVKDEFGEILAINTDNGKVKEVLHNLFYDILNIEFNLWPWIRNLCKYGDFFLFLEISEKYGITNVIPLSVYDTQRMEGTDPLNPHYVFFETLGLNGMKNRFENYEIAHFRMLSDTNFLPYGMSCLEGARRLHRAIVLMEDAMMIHRIMRAPEKRVFHIDVGNIPPNEIPAYMQGIIDRSKKATFIDETTGEYNQRYNMQNILEDFYFPVRGKDNGTKIDTLGGLEYNSIEDIEYLQGKLFAALKIPRAFLAYEEGLNGKATLASQDSRFMRTVERIQRIVVSELTKIAIVHLYSQGFSDEELVSFSLSLTMPSTIYEQEKVNLWTQKMSLITQAQATNMISDDWAYENILNMTADEYIPLRDKMVEDKKFRFRLAQIEQGQSDPAKFGFPQERPPEESIMGGEEGGAPAGGAPQSLNDLPMESVEEDGRGQPRKGVVYGQDSHPRGRDPLGYKERYKAMHFAPERKDKPKSPLSLESRHLLNTFRQKRNSTLKSVLLEDQDAGTYLDESNILDD